MAIKLIKPTWPVPDNILAFTTTRGGGVSQHEFDSLNLALHVGDNSDSVRKNRDSITRFLPSTPVWLKQTHSDAILDLAMYDEVGQRAFDASMSDQPNRVCCVMSADCLPLLISDRAGGCVAAVHAGWRGLVNGIIIKVIKRMISKYHLRPSDLLVWLGPAISQQHFQVGSEVKVQLQQAMPILEPRVFVQGSSLGKWYADIYQIARLQLQLFKDIEVFGGEYCTYEQQSLFFSHRRATHHNFSRTGRMASVICVTDNA